jgi:hypothetical protein
MVLDDRQSLIVIHGDNRIQRYELTVCKCSICRQGPYQLETLRT